MHIGMWATAAVVTIGVSWMMYRYLAPRGRQEWWRAGVVQAFIIAFYAEMYGFPLTTYFLVRALGVDFSRTRGGNPWALLFGTPLAHVVAMVAGYTLVFLGGGLVVAGWRAVHRARRDERLVTDGVYSRVRHPQYAGLFLIIFGEGLVHWPTFLSLGAFPVIVLAYTLLARREERQMVEQFGERYRDYSTRVPMFIPRCNGSKSP